MMDRFNSGDIIPVGTLNEVDDYINQLYTFSNSNSLDQNLYDTIQVLYNAWQGIQTGDDSTSISDEIDAIRKK